MSDLPTSPATGTPPVAALMHRGQALESRGELSRALTLYDQAVARLRVLPAEDPETRRQLGVAWMNRGNVLQKLDGSENLAAAVQAYDAAIAQLQTLPFDLTPAYRNHLGAAWLNRGHALLRGDDPAAAAESLEQAIALLRHLPLHSDPAYRINLAGAWTNLAHALHSAPLHAFPRAHTAAQTALDLLAVDERAHLAVAEMSLRARRALIIALGELLVIAERRHQPTSALAAEASDTIDDGLALARHWEKRGGASLRPLATRVFHLGAHLYRVHQPHFLPEFIGENLGPDADAGDAERRAIAAEALAAALADLQRPQLLVAGAPNAEKLLATARALRAAQRSLAPLRSEFSSP